MSIKFKRLLSIALAAVFLFVICIFGWMDSSCFGASRFPDRVEGVRAANTYALETTLKWNRVDNADGYKIYRSTSKEGTYGLIASVPSKSSPRYRDTGLKENSLHYYKVRAFIKDNGQCYYGKSSLPKAILTKENVMTWEGNQWFTQKKVQADFSKFWYEQDTNLKATITVKNLNYDTKTIKKIKYFKFYLDGKLFGVYTSSHKEITLPPGGEITFDITCQSGSIIDLPKTGKEDYFTIKYSFGY